MERSGVVTVAPNLFEKLHDGLPESDPVGQRQFGILYAVEKHAKKFLTRYETANDLYIVWRR